MTTLTRWNPFRELDVIQNRLNTLLGRPLLTGNGEETLTAAEWSPLVDVSETDKEYLIKAELPEVKKEDVKVTIEDGALHISGERKFEKEEKDRKYHRIERSYGSFERVFVLPEGAKAGEVKATFHDGMLEVRLPKSEKPQAKTVEVNVA
jgi:HSP20 family protein